MRVNFRIQIRRLVFLSFFLSALSTLEAEGVPLFQGTYYPGDVIRVFFFDQDQRVEKEERDGENPSSIITVKLLYRDRKDLISETTCFPLHVPYDNSTYMGFMGLLGVPSTLAPGEYLLEWDRGNGTRGSRWINVLKRDFVREDIPLNGAMTDLRTSPDPRKIEEYQQLIILLEKVNQDHQFCTGKQEMPLYDGIYTSYYGDRREYVYSDGNRASAIHNGIDLAAPRGTPVLAGGDGLVVFAGQRIITGNSVILEHMPGMYGLYYHLDTISVEVGDLVDQGDTIGTLGSTGLATGPHLHWEIRVAGVPVKPELFIEKPVIDKEEIVDMMKQLNYKGGD